MAAANIQLQVEEDIMEKMSSTYWVKDGDEDKGNYANVKSKTAAQQKHPGKSRPAGRGYSSTTSRYKHERKNRPGKTLYF